MTVRDDNNRPPQNSAALVSIRNLVKHFDITGGWLEQLITDRIDGFDADAIARRLGGDGDGIKTTVEIAPGS